MGSQKNLILKMTSAQAVETSVTKNKIASLDSRRSDSTKDRVIWSLFRLQTADLETLRATPLLCFVVLALINVLSFSL